MGLGYVYHPAGCVSPLSRILKGNRECFSLSIRRRMMEEGSGLGSSLVACF